MTATDEKVLTSLEVREQIAAALGKGEKVFIEIGSRKMEVTWIGEQDASDPPRSPKWRIEVT